MQDYIISIEIQIQVNVDLPTKPAVISTEAGKCFSELGGLTIHSVIDYLGDDT